MKKIIFAVMACFLALTPALNAAETKAAGTLDMEAFTKAVQAFDLAQVKDIVKWHAVNVSDDKGFFPLYVAAKEGTPEIVEFLIEQGADVNFVGKGKKVTALCVASAKQKLDTVLVLLEHKADTNKCPALAYEMINKDDKKDIILELIKHGAKVNEVGMLKATPLMLAAAFGKIEHVKILLDNKADVNFVSANFTPLSAAIKAIGQPNAYAIVELLVNKGASLKIANDNRKEKEPLWQDKYKASDFKGAEQKEAQKLITYLKALAAKEAKAAPAQKSSAPVKKAAAPAKK